MNAQTQTHTSSRTHVADATAPSRPTRRDRVRDFGVGYGNSSGYASGRRYTGTSSTTRFRFA